MIESDAPDEPRSPRSLGLIGSAHGLDRQPDTLRYARDTASTRRDPHSWWEPNIPKPKPKPFRATPPMKDAPSGLMLSLQVALLAKPRRWLTLDRVCWIVGVPLFVWFCWALLHGP
ncbi:MAG: hypothetical protein ABIP42_18030, partial [Planctomycetota bacterium]